HKVTKKGEGLSHFVSHSHDGVESTIPLTGPNILCFEPGLRQVLKDAQGRHMNIAIVVPRLQERHIAEVITTGLWDALDFLSDEKRACEMLCHCSRINDVEFSVTERQKMSVTKYVRPA